jgi:hypothetical protein
MQSEVFLNPARFRVIVAGRRSGKSYLSIAELIRAARSGYHKLCWYIGPSYRQAKSVLWEALKSAVPSRWLLRKNEVDLSLTLAGTGSVIALRSADSPDSLRGVGLNFCVVDEFSSMAETVWSEVLRPALSDKMGQAIICGSPRGFNALHQLFVDAQEKPDWQGFHFSTEQGGLVTPEEIANVRATVDPRVFAQEFDADFEQSVSRVFLMFSRKYNLRPDVEDTGGPLLVGMDMNVNPMSCVISQRAGDQLHTFDELALHNSNTSETAEALKQKYPGRRITVYPDPSGRARKTSAAAGVTDLSILEAAGFTVVAPHEQYGVVDRVNTSNALLCNASGLRRWFIHPRCKYLIRALEQTSYKKNTSVVDKSKNLEHHADAAGYLIMAEFPLVPSGLLTAEMLQAAVSHPVAPYLPPPEPEPRQATMVRLTR